jgi:deoxyribodipyrimidine photolyase-related protein
MKKFIIFPHQLFPDIDLALLKSFDEIIIFEEPIFFFDAKYRPFYTNKVKLAYLRACALFYSEFLSRTSGLKAVRHVRYEDIIAMTADEYKSIISGGTCYEYHDNVLRKKLTEKGVSLSIIHDSPMFLATKEFMDAYHSSTTTKAHSSQTHFFNALKQKLNILPNVKSTDKQNRRSIPRKVLDALRKDHSTYDSKYHHAGIEFATHTRFAKHVGCAENVAMYPCTFQQASKHLSDFLKMKFVNFGPFQDAISQDHIFLFHSGLSPAMNVGILSPRRVVEETLRFAQLHHIPMNSCEGFIRQIVGWRERCMYIYHYYYESLRTKDFWQRGNRLAWTRWRQGSTGLSILDNEIRKASSTGYAHHIIRLMLFLNIMVLSEIKFDDVYRWFMEVCAIDAYDWVMVSNIGSMGFFDERFMSKPYIATSNYLVKMSDYKLVKTEREALDSLFYSFLHIKKEMLKREGKTQANVYLRNLAFFEKKSANQQAEILAMAKHTIARLTQ